MEKKRFEIKEYEKHGVAVLVQIDYDNKMISIVEPQKGSVPTIYKAKLWNFSHRELEYMQGWQNILDAIKYAVEQATLSMRKHVEAEDKATEKRQIAMARALNKEK